MKRVITLLLALLICNVAHGQEWHRYQSVESIKELSLRFRAKSPSISIKYAIEKKSISKGSITQAELYIIDNNGVNTPQRGTMTHSEGEYSFTYEGIDYTKAGHKIRGFEFQLWMPVGCRVTSLEVGVEDGSFFEYADARVDRPIAIYCAEQSATQSAGERGAAMISRAMDRQVWQVKSMKELCEVDAVSYVIDSRLVKSKELESLRALRANTPIVVSEYSNSAEYAERVESELRTKLHAPKGSISTTIPVTQRRVPSQEWQRECRMILDNIRTSNATCAIIGNSIVHNWGGSREEGFSRHESWNRYMSNYVNLGIGADRIENVLSRVYNDQMDVKEFEKIIIMIGTNNLNAKTSYEDIVVGVDNLVAQIKYRQPSAEITLVGILPRKDYPWAELQRINMEYERIAKEHNIRYKCIGHALMNENDEWRAELFSDRVHPNTKGYDAIAQALMAE